MRYLSTKIFIIGGLLLLLTATIYDNSMAQQNNQWRPQERIPAYGDESIPPYMVADQNRTVHIFNTQPLSPDEDDISQAIFYRQWSLEGKWTQPIDILLSPDQSIPIILGTVIDESDVIHLIFFAGNNRAAGLYYTYAPALQAGKAPAWKTPELIGANAGPSAFAAMELDSEGNFFVVYTGREDGVGLYEVHSKDGGESWSAPKTVLLVYEEEQWPSAIRIHADEKGYLHAVWSVWSGKGVSLAIYYAQLEIAEGIWSEPMTLAIQDETDYEADWASVISYKDEIFVFYQDSGPATRWMRRSKDNGETWSNPVQPFPHQGEFGHSVMLTDSAGTLHLLLGNRRDDEGHGMWHSTWLGDRWGSLRAIVSGRKTPEFDPSAPQAVLSQGNVLLVSWWTDTGGGKRNGAWYSYVELDTPESPIIPLSTPAPTATRGEETGIVEADSTPVATPTANPTLEAALRTVDGGPQTSSPALALLFSVTPVAALILTVVAVRRFKPSSSSRRD